MNDKEVSNLPSTYLKKTNVIEYLKRIINSRKEIKKVDEIIDSLSKIKEYDVLSMPAFKHIVGNKIKDNKDGVIIMSDINNLYEANKFSSKENVNKDINFIISEMKSKAAEKCSEEFDIGKLGDEIYLHLPHLSEEKANEILQEFRNIKINSLSISCGFTSNLEQGIELAIEESENKMYEDKTQYKYNKLMDFCKGNINKIIDYTIENELNKSRINISNLRDKSQRMEFVNVYDRLISNKSVNEIINKNVKDTQDEISIDKNKELREKYRREADMKFGNSSNEIKEKYILAQFLSRGKVDGTVNGEYFEKFEKGKLKNKNNFELLALDISGLKFVNDKYGHSQGDKEIEKVLGNISNSLNEENIKSYTNIVVKGAGNAFVVIPKIKDNKRSAIIDKMSNLESKLDVICTIKNLQDIENEDKAKNNIDKFEDLRNVTEQDLSERSFERKVKDEKNVEKLICGIYNSIFDNSIINGAIKYDKEKKEYIKEKIDKRFSKIVIDQKGNSNVISFDEKKMSRELINDNPTILKEDISKKEAYIK